MEVRAVVVANHLCHCQMKLWSEILVVPALEPMVGNDGQRFDLGCGSHLVSAATAG